MTDLIELVKKSVDNCEDLYKLLLEFSIELKINCDLNMINIEIGKHITYYNKKLQVVNKKKRKLDNIINNLCDHPHSLVEFERDWNGHNWDRSYFCKLCKSYIRNCKIARYSND